MKAVLILSFFKQIEIEITNLFTKYYKILELYAYVHFKYPINGIYYYFLIYELKDYEKKF